VLLHDDAIRRRLEQAAVQLIAQYDWSRAVKQFAEVLTSAKSKNPFQSGGWAPPTAGGYSQ
jgi:hypothetical protein